MSVSTILALLAMSGSGAAAPSQGRVDAIWAAADERMARQMDAWFDDGEFPSCIQLLYMRADLYPNDYEIATDLGWMLENVKEDEKAIAVYEQYIASNPNDPDASIPVAQHWFLKKDYKKVIELLEPVVGDKLHANGYRMLAHSYERAGRLQDSAKTWEKYISLKPDDAPAKVNLARVKKKLSDGAAASKR